MYPCGSHRNGEAIWTNLSVTPDHLSRNETRTFTIIFGLTAISEIAKINVVQNTHRDMHAIRKLYLDVYEHKNNYSYEIL